MNRITKIIVLSFLPALLWMSDLSGQAKVIDRIVGVVGEFHILQSDIESMYLQNRAQGVSMPGDMKCNILEDFLSQKLLVNQAKIDSIEIPESNVEMSLESRIQYFTSMIGSQEALEEYFDKSIIEIKEDMRKSVREQLLTQEMQGIVTAGVTVTPSEIKEYYKSLHEDSIPYINSKVELSQITMYPPVDEEAIFDVKQRLLDLRRRIQDGEKFTTLAVLYSEGPSAPDGGDLGFFGRGQMVPEFTKAAYSLKEGGISTIVESSFGYHLIQLVERKEDRVHARHILMKPVIDPEVLRTCRMNVDSLADFIRMDSISFEIAAMRYSHDKHTAVNGGVMVNPVDNTTRFELDQLEASEYVALRDLKVGEISDAFESVDENQKQIFKIVKIMSQSEPHKANVKDDYDILLGMALLDKKNKVFQEWLDEKITETYVKIDDAYTGCKFSRDGWIKN
jgi:peptidyl-prolyl cis-trans isomerase SurA